MKKSVQRKIVRDVMTCAPKTVGPRTDLPALKAMFQTYQFNAFPVVDEHQVLLGLVSKFDLLRTFSLEPSRWIPDVRALFAEHVEDIMSRGVVLVRPEEPIAAIIDVIVGSKLRTVPVAERRDGKDVLVGIVTRHDVLPYLVLVGDAQTD
jgi:CBS domain-containing protein